MFIISNNKIRLTDEAYNSWTKLVLLIFPGLSSVLFGASYIFDLSNAKLIMGMIAVVSFVLGVCVTVSLKNYKTSDAMYDGQLVVVVPEDGPKVFTLQLNSDPEELELKDTIVFKVKHDVFEV